MVQGHLSEIVPGLCLLAALCSWRAVDAIKKYLTAEVAELKKEIKELRRLTGIPEPPPRVAEVEIKNAQLRP